LPKEDVEAAISYKAKKQAQKIDMARLVSSVQLDGRSLFDERSKSINTHY